MRLPSALALLSLLLACSGSQGDDDTPAPTRDAAQDATSTDSGGDGSAATEDCSLTCNRAPGTCECTRPETECSTDDDCEIGRNIATCCDGCPTPYPRSLVDAESCLVGEGDPVRECTPPMCEEDLECPSVRCPPMARAVCEAGKCIASTECPEDQILVADRCQPRCATADDCVVAVGGQSCCGSCPRAMHKDTVASLTCVVAEGETAPTNCTPSAEQCEGVGCPDVQCAEVTGVTCNEGRCQTVTE